MDLFHTEYRELTDAEKHGIEELKKTALLLLEDFERKLNEKNGREIALAKTKLEEAVMWAVKGATK